MPIRGATWQACEHGGRMSIRLGRQATRQLTHAGLVLSAPRGRRRQLTATLIVLGALAIGAAAGYAYWLQNPIGGRQLAEALHERQQLQQRLEQSLMTLRLSEARSKELERQIDALNQRLRECQEELTFFRQAKDGKRPSS